MNLPANNLFTSTLGKPKPYYWNTLDFCQRNPGHRSVFLFNPNMLAHHSAMVQRSFPGEVSYAVKANPRPEILRALWDSGIRSFDVASIGEVKQVYEQFWDQDEPCSLHFNNPIKSREDIDQAFHRYGVRSFVIDDALGLESLLPYVDLAGHRGLEITVRFKLPHANAAYDFGSKFGANLEQSSQLLRRIQQSGGVPALTFHPGSQCTDPDVYHRYIEAAASISNVSGVTLSRLNVGGGFPVMYDNTEVAELNDFFAEIEGAVARYFPHDSPRLLCEPGRAMVAGCCRLLTNVVHVRETGEVYLDDGVYGSLQEQLVMNAKLPIRVIRDAKVLPRTGPDRTLFGPTCDPIDRLSGSYQLRHDLRPGDQVEFSLVGAYGSATTTWFNGFSPAEYITVEGVE